MMVFFFFLIFIFDNLFLKEREYSIEFFKSPNDFRQKEKKNTHLGHWKLGFLHKKKIIF
jgi:hypothetical protein